jgi:hypothetical protein
MDISQRLGWLQLELLGSWDPNAATCKENSRKLGFGHFQETVFDVFVRVAFFSGRDQRFWCPNWQVMAGSLATAETLGHKLAGILSSFPARFVHSGKP